ncbi:MAG TPA: IS1634 family transposase [Mycobacterium sp.]|nr:IS1634 family transposase [Mycobacterium sp.]
MREYRQALLRRSFRNAAGKPSKETLANLSALPDVAIDAIRKILAGKTLVDVEESFTVERSLAHGHVGAVHVMASQLRFAELLGPPCPERDTAYALILSRVVAPRSKLATTQWWNDTSLGHDLGIVDAHSDAAYAAMDWLGARQVAIEKKLAGRHLESGGTAMFDLSSAWYEGTRCELAKFGYSRDKKRGLPQVEFGLLTDGVGRPVAIRVFPGNTSDSRSFIDAVTTVRETFGLKNLTMIGDRGMITNTRVKDLKDSPGLDWITALRAPAIAALASDDGPLQMSLFDVQNFAEITHPDFPGERLVCCRNPALAQSRTHTRQELLTATEQNLNTIVTSVEAGRLHGAANIGKKIGKVINRHKMEKHFTTSVTDDSFSYRRDEAKISAEEKLDGIYVIRTSVSAEKLSASDVVGSYKNLTQVERDFRSIKSDDLDLRPIRHYRKNRVEAHIFLCMLASHLTWHLRHTLAPLTFTDDNVPHRDDPVAPAQRSPQAKKKDALKKSVDDVPLHNFTGLLEHLATLTRNTISFAGQQFEKIAETTPAQRRAFELLGAPVPLTITLPAK